MTDATFRSAGYAVSSEENPGLKIQNPGLKIHSKNNTFAFSDDKLSPLRNSKKQSQKFFLAIYKHFFEFAHILCGAAKPTIASTDNKLVARFYRTKANPPLLWTAFD